MAAGAVWHGAAAMPGRWADGCHAWAAQHNVSLLTSKPAQPRIPPRRCKMHPGSLEAVGCPVAALALESPPALFGEHAVGDVRAHMRRPLCRQQLLALDQRAACKGGGKWSRTAVRAGEAVQ